ncbi:protein kinase, putative [Bodo saltans]|uniref:Protein kinase, putative n=1 Tax=Bodo saltans TaxID=75058 RepID=A0A0S4JV21_BODSA|nr:protein kinase, putative [Bodo saltans]|eukprot:CUG94148.1 protein kinase, putative [Bodo saltans]
MFSRVVGAGAQALVLQLRDASLIDTSGVPDVHQQQAKNRGCVVKIIRTEPWLDWLESNYPSTINTPPHLTKEALNRQLCCVSRVDVARMAAGAKRISTLRSNFVVPYLSVLATDDEVRITMPKYSMSLQDWAYGHQKELTEVGLLKIASQLALGLIDLHDEGIFHLDFHGGNVFVANSKSSEPHCVIADLEASYYDGINHDVPREFTENFAAPERRDIRAPRSLPAGAGPPVGVALEATLGKCDVWSLGLVLFSMGAGHEFPGLAESTDELGSILMNHEKLTPTRIAAIVRRDLTVGHDGHRTMAAFSEGLISLLTMMLNHDAATRPSLYNVMDSIQKLLENTSSRSSQQRSLPFPLALAPFQLVVLPDELARRVEWYPGSSMYDVHAPCARCKKNRSLSRRQRSDCLKDQSMHLPSHTSHHWGGSTALPTLPLLPGLPHHHSSDIACFLYPMYCDGAASHEALAELQRGQYSPPSGSDVLVRLLQLQGGFAFAGAGDSACESVRPKVIFTFVPLETRVPPPLAGGSAQFLQFTAAQSWPSSCTEGLKQAGRIHTDVPSLLGTTAQCFSWIMPGEQFLLPNDEAWTPAPYGGFVFWFEPDARQPNDQDRYFALCETTGLEVGNTQRGLRTEALAIASRASSVLSSAAGSIVGAIASKVHSAGGGRTQHQPSSSVQPYANFPIARDGEPMESPAHVTNLTDRTPAGRMYFNDLDAVSPATYVNRSDVSSSIAEPPGMPRPVTHSPEVVARLTRTNIEGYRIHVPDSREGSLRTATTTADSSRHASESRPSTLAQTAANSAAGSRAPSQSQSSSIHVHSAVFQQQGSSHHHKHDVAGNRIPSRYPSEASATDDVIRGRRSTSMLNSSQPDHLVASGSLLAFGLPPKHSQSSDAAHARQEGAPPLRFSSTDAVSTRPASYIDGVMPPPTRTGTPVDQLRGAGGGAETDDVLSRASSVLTDASPVIVRGNQPGPRSTPSAAYPSQQLRFDPSPSVGAPPVVEDPFGRRTASLGSGTMPLGTSPNRVVSMPGSSLDIKPKATAQAPAAPWTEWSFPVVEATLYFPGPELTHSTNETIGSSRFRIVQSGEFGSCGPVVPMTPSSLLFRRLQLPSNRGISFACFCAVDMHSEQLGASSVGPGGARAASAYHANERFLQHHGMILFDDDFRPRGLVTFRVFVKQPGDAATSLSSGGSTSSSPFPTTVLLPIMPRAVIPGDQVTNYYHPVGDMVEFDPFLSPPQLNAQPQSQRYSRGTAGGMSTGSSTMMSSRASSAVTSAHSSFTSGRVFAAGLGGSPTRLALDLNNNQLFVGCSSSTSWLQLCFT